MGRARPLEVVFAGLVVGGMGWRVAVEEALVAAAGEEGLAGEGAELGPVGREVGGSADVEGRGLEVVAGAGDGERAGAAVRAQGLDEATPVGGSVGAVASRGRHCFD